MAELVFSEFAQLLNKYCQKEETDKASFVMTLTDNFVTMPGRHNKHGEFVPINPMRTKGDKEKSILNNLYYGRQNFSSSDSSRLLGKSRPDRFVCYINSFPSNAKGLIIDDLQKLGFSVTTENVAEKCAYIMEAILRDGKYTENK